MLTLDLETTRRLAKVVRDRVGPDFKYCQAGMFGCYYVPRPDIAIDDPRSQTGCYVGEIAKLAGVDMDRLGELEEPARSNEVQDLLGTVDYDVLDYLGTLQTLQDGGETWHEAYRRAEQTLEEK